MTTKNLNLRGAALTSHARKQLEDDRKDGAQIEIEKSLYICPCCGGRAWKGEYTGPATFLKVWSCLPCGKSFTKGGFTQAWVRDMNSRPDDKKRAFLYGARAEEVKLETRKLFTVSL